MVTCIALLCIWLTGCTLAASSGRASGAQPTPRFSPPPRLTITVYELATPPPSPTRIAYVQTAVQPSPAPTATPKLYTVEENDTLLDIAIRFDVSLEALLAANPDVDSRVLQIGQSIVIPMPEQSADEIASQLENSPPAPLPVTAPVCYPTATDSVVCLGSVRNDQAAAVERVEIEVQILDADNRTLGTQVATLEQSYIAPGELAPYRVLFPDIEAQRVVTVATTLLSAAVTDTIEARFVPLTVENTRVEQVGRGYRVTADLVSNAGRTANAPRVVVTLLDADERVYGYRVWQGDDPLPPNMRTTMQLMLSPVQDAPPNLNYQLHVEAPALLTVP